MLNSAVQSKLIATNPCDHATLPRIPHTEAMCLSPQQVQKFLDEVKRADDPWWTYWLTLAHTGMRPSEGLGLQWGDLGKGTISIARTVVRHDAEGCEVKGCTHLFEDAKTARSRRTITIPAIVIEALNAHRKSVGSIGMARALIFPGEHGTPPDMRTLVRLHFDPHRKRAKLPKCSPYVLRHSHISALLADGVPVAEVSQRVGHASAVMTLNTYAHVLVGGSDRLAKAIERYAQGSA